jgi:hypothetical protein
MMTEDTTPYGKEPDVLVLEPEEGPKDPEAPPKEPEEEGEETPKAPEEGPPTEAPVPEEEQAPVASGEVQPRLGLQEYVSLAGLNPKQSAMLQTWMLYHGHVDPWGHFERAAWDGYVREARAYIPSV